MTKPIDWNKPVELVKPCHTTESLRLLCTDAPGPYPVKLLCGQDVLSSTLEGNLGSCGFEVRNKVVKKSGWINVYLNGTLGYRSHPTREEAMKAATSGRGDTIFIEWEVE